jgi:hypothetical protein
MEPKRSSLKAKRHFNSLSNIIPRRSYDSSRRVGLKRGKYSKIKNVNEDVIITESTMDNYSYNIPVNEEELQNEDEQGII